MFSMGPGWKNETGISASIKKSTFPCGTRTARPTLAPGQAAHVPAASRCSQPGARKTDGQHILTTVIRKAPLPLSFYFPVI